GKSQTSDIAGYIAGEFQRRLGDRGIADAGRVVEISMHRGEDVGFVVRRIGVDAAVAIDANVVPAGAEHDCQGQQQTCASQYLLRGLVRVVLHGHVDERKRHWLRPFAIAPKTTPKPPITVDIMACRLWVKISRV